MTEKPGYTWMFKGGLIEMVPKSKYDALRVKYLRKRASHYNIVSFNHDRDSLSWDRSARRSGLYSHYAWLINDRWAGWWL